MTLAQVHFLFEDQLLQGIRASLLTTLKNANQSRNFTCATLLPNQLMDIAAGPKVRSTPSDLNSQTTDKTDNSQPDKSADVSIETDSNVKNNPGLSLSDIGAFSADPSSSSFPDNNHGSSPSLSSGQKTVSLDLSTKPLTKKSSRVADHKLVRSDSRTQSLDSFYSMSKKPSNSFTSSATSSTVSSSSNKGSALKEVSDIICDTCDDVDMTQVGNFGKRGLECNCGKGRVNNFKLLQQEQERAEQDALFNESDDVITSKSSDSPQRPRKRMRNFTETTCSYESVQSLIAEVRFTVFFLT